MRARVFRKPVAMLEIQAVSPLGLTRIRCYGDQTIDCVDENLQFVGIIA